MSLSFPVKETYTMDDLLEIMRLLRSPGGCPWDRVQTHESIRSNFLEETCEAIEAIDQKDTVLLKEELGDVLMQVVFHAQMEQENGSFTFADVVDGLVKKLVVRHPHVFADANAETPTEVLATWDSVKRKTKGEGTTQADLLRSVPRALPSPMRAAKVQDRARRVGFDWRDVSGAMAALTEEVEELRAAIPADDPAAMDEELGDVLFSAVNVSRFLNVDAEQSLTASTDKFIRRFTRVEQLAVERHIDMAQASIEELDVLWKEAKL